jgi:hypothetical protein
MDGVDGVHLAPAACRVAKLHPLLFVLILVVLLQHDS